MHFLIWLIIIVFIISGVLASAIPGFPGGPLAFVGLLLAAWFDHFAKVEAGIIVTLGLLCITSMGIDFLATALGAQKSAASPRAVCGAAIGALIGIFLGLFGNLFGAFFGAFLGEAQHHAELLRYGKMGLPRWIGMILRTSFRLGLVFAILSIFLTAYWF